MKVNDKLRGIFQHMYVKDVIPIQNPVFTAKRNSENETEMTEGKEFSRETDRKTCSDCFIKRVIDSPGEQLNILPQYS